MTLYVYTIIGEHDNWDEAINAGDIKTVATFVGDTNAECERLAAEAGYDDPDNFGWTYTNPEQ